MRKLLLIIFILNLFQLISFGQTYSTETKTILYKLDSLLYLDTLHNGKLTLEFRQVGEGGNISEKFLLYSKLVKVATEKELLVILNNPKELEPTRGYAYMAYAYRCDQEKRKETTLNYNFKLNTLNGCIGLDDTSFSEFKKYIRERNKYNPNPSHIVNDAQEQRVIEKENQVRKEQNIPLRK